MAASLPIVTATVYTNSENISVPAYLAHPVNATGCPIVIVIQEVFGVNAHIKDVADRIAHEGYIAIAPHIYHRQAPGFEVGYGEADLALGRQYKNGTRADELLSDIRAAIAYGRSNFDSRLNKVGCIGFCFGGHVAYLAATLPDVAATASFYGAGICSFTPGGTTPTVSRTSEIQGKVYGFFGLQDPLIPTSDMDEIEAALHHCGVDHQIYRYPNAGHGFFCDQRESYDQSSAEDAWFHVLSLYEDTLKPTRL
ncbi:dienelactone hydrolase family protein [Oscillatoria sp. CS-180]|uniref:dienelactone hydrolase family protein n=1 Tax=Oscillatoria sp. CS-180 TaxID=3021720 RepID=UPI00232C6030|nr:dienelactone hydrolase family protein [Oscillatoria sp. CS-180]MDB9525901.1 dienelactone hydrolase family protein [Oscillatoria sp. CS-180]